MPLPTDIGKVKEARLEEKAKAAAEMANERAILKNLFADTKWQTMELTIWRQREAAKKTMLTTTNHDELIDARSYYRALTWVLELPQNIP